MLRYIAIATLTACGTQNISESDVEAAVLLPAKVTFAKDNRPSDGALVQVKMVRGVGGKYQISMRTERFNRIKREKEVELVDLGSALSCTLLKGSAFNISKLVCLKDQRPVDGKLNEITIEKKALGYSVTQHIAFADRINHRNVDETTEVASGLQRK